MITDAELKSERGRRNAARRKSFGDHHKGMRMVWKTHRPAAWRCRCPKCLLARMNDVEAGLEGRIEARHRAEGAVPAWAEEARARVRFDRAEVERAIAARGLEGIDYGQPRARKGDEEQAAFKQAA